MMGRRVFLATIVLFLLLLSLGSHAAEDPPLAAKRSSSPIAFTPDGATLLVVNPDSNSLTLVATVSRSVLAEVPVGVDPRSVAVSPDGSRAYVANQGTDSLSVVDIAARAVIADVAVGDRPVGVAVSPNGRFVAVAELGVDRVCLLDAAALSSLSLITVADRPYGLTFTPDGQHLLVTHLLSGEVTVLWVQPYRAYLPITLKGHGMRSLNIPPSSQAPTLRLRSGQVSNLQSQIPTWPAVAPAPSVLVNAAGTRAYLPQTMANGLGFNTSFDTMVFPKVSVLNLETQ
jgi:YVTN family beta-propeller protein